MVILYNAVGLLFQFLETLIIIEVLLSWVYRGENSLTRLLHIFTDPFLIPGKRIQERIIPGLPVDFSPVIALFILMLLRNVIYSILRLF
ncbi:YGGT family protein [Clostridium homopropionicum DSM 5847]|uniref:YGGT family protein n=1 Tax=Clostridium homopropionicum DSM 5847 TaxID=1121318 RepID=A0A0L6ZDB5_9CLOT|nr:YggT family protein [Clostridium homopropionicum]KOA20971.1 YGGT family protein [Clostridium homopropionicum DSM 5847]SFG00720.1 YggT family protein [Clostridium homopropionicum]